MANSMYSVIDITLWETNKLIIVMKDSSAISYERIATSRSWTHTSDGLDLVCTTSWDPYLSLSSTAYAADAQTLASIYDVKVTAWKCYYE